MHTCKTALGFKRYGAFGGDAHIGIQGITRREDLCLDYSNSLCII